MDEPGIGLINVKECDDFNPIKDKTTTRPNPQIGRSNMEISTILRYNCKLMAGTAPTHGMYSIDCLSFELGPTLRQRPRIRSVEQEALVICVDVKGAYEHYVHIVDHVPVTHFEATEIRFGKLLTKELALKFIRKGANHSYWLAWLHFCPIHRQFNCSLGVFMFAHNSPK
jgi:hypothetical protein